MYFLQYPLNFRLAVEVGALPELLAMPFNHLPPCPCNVIPLWGSYQPVTPPCPLTEVMLVISLMDDSQWSYRTLCHSASWPFCSLMSPPMASSALCHFLPTCHPGPAYLWELHQLLVLYHPSCPSSSPARSLNIACKPYYISFLNPFFYFMYPFFSDITHLLASSPIPTSILECRK